MDDHQDEAPRRQPYDRRSTDQGAKTRHRKSVLLSTVASTLGICGVIAPVAWIVLSPWLVGVLSTAMADEIKDQVKQQIAPLNAGFKAILQQNIDRLRREIEALEFKSRSGTMTADEARDLADKRIELDGQRGALAAIVTSELSQAQ